MLPQPYAGNIMTQIRRERAVVSTPQTQLYGGMRSFSAATDETAIIGGKHKTRTCLLFVPTQTSFLRQKTDRAPRS